jgi:hypothetical protein
VPGAGRFSYNYIASQAQLSRSPHHRCHVGGYSMKGRFGPNILGADHHGPGIGLAKAAYCGQPERTMARLSPKHFLTMLLAVFVTVGVSVSVVQASTMAMKMTMGVEAGMTVASETGMSMPGMGAANDSDCKACLKGTGDNGNPMHCPPTCIAPVLAVLPPEFAAMTVIRAPLPSALPTPFLHGRSSLPDPFPPKSIDLV